MTILYAFGLAFGGLGITVALSPWPWPIIAIAVALLLSYVILRQLNYVRIHLVLRSFQQNWEDRNRAKTETVTTQTVTLRSSTLLVEQETKQRKGSDKFIEERTWSDENSPVPESRPSPKS